MQLLRYAHDAARGLLGEGTYQKIAGAVLSGPIGRRLALATHSMRDLGPRHRDLIRLHNQEIAVTLSLGVQYAYNSFIAGDVVEFGTDSGFSARVLARAMRAAELHRPPKNLHLFDSFVGLPEATSAVDRDSYEVRAGIWRAGACRLMSKDELFRSCGQIVDPHRIVMHEGWFADTVARLSPGQTFCFVHFDGDLYQSTIDAIGGLLRRGAISNGAIICFDDWNCGQAAPNFGERRAWRELVEEFGVSFSDWRSYSTMGRGFFVHDYRRPAKAA
jgi:O-methyltransferase